MTPGFIIETLIYIISMEFLSQSRRCSSSRNILSGEEARRNNCFHRLREPLQQVFLSLSSPTPSFNPFLPINPHPFFDACHRGYIMKEETIHQPVNVFLTISCSFLLCQKKASFSLLPSLQVPGLYFVLTSKPDIIAINVKMDSSWPLESQYCKRFEPVYLLNSDFSFIIALFALLCLTLTLFGQIVIKSRFIGS